MDERKRGLTMLTQKTFNRMRYRAVRGTLGKFNPQRILPRELWRILFMPDEFAKSRRGDLPPESKIALNAPRAKSAIHDLICSMLSHQRLPSLCCRCQGYFIPKHRGASD